MSDLLARLIAAGTPAELVGEVALLVAKAQLLEERRANDRDRKDRQRHVMSRDVTGQSGQDVTSPSREGALTEPTTTNSSVPIQKNNKEEKQDSGSGKPNRIKRLIPDDFEPSEATMARAKELGFSPGALADRVASMREWSLGKGEKRLDWDLVLQGFLRRDAAKATGPPGRPTNGVNGWAQLLRDLDDDETGFTRTIEGTGDPVPTGKGSH